MKFLATIILGFLAVSCATAPPTADKFAKSMVSAASQTNPKPTYPTGSIFANGTDLYPTIRTYQVGELEVGDLITVVFTETASSTRSAGVTTGRTSSNDVLGAGQAAALLPGGAFFDGLSLSGNRIDHTGTGTSNQSATLSGQIATVVTEVLPNGNLRIEGQKQLEFTEGSEHIQLSGVIRPEDVQPNNMILSTRIAQSQISYSGNGALASASNPGWMTRALYSIWPF